jgi:hypothetical protein
VAGVVCDGRPAGLAADEEVRAQSLLDLVDAAGAGAHRGAAASTSADRRPLDACDGGSVSDSSSRGPGTGRRRTVARWRAGSTPGTGPARQPLVYTRAQAPAVGLGAGENAHRDLGAALRGAAADVFLIKCSLWAG